MTLGCITWTIHGAGRTNCNGLGTKKYISRDTYASEISKNFCPAAALTVGHTDKKETMMTMVSQTPEEAEVKISWSDDTDLSKFSKEECEKQFLHPEGPLDGCDQDGSTNPMNWKGGGKMIAAGFEYSITPLNERKPAPNKPYVFCKYDTACGKDPAVVRGAGWLNIGDGYKLQDELKGKDFWRDGWEFQYKKGDDSDMGSAGPQEWEAKFTLEDRGLDKNNEIKGALEEGIRNVLHSDVKFSCIDNRPNSGCEVGS